jgi:hypothetical protein
MNGGNAYTKWFEESRVATLRGQNMNGGNAYTKWFEESRVAALIINKKSANGTAAVAATHTLLALPEIITTANEAFAATTKKM